MCFFPLEGAATTARLIFGTGRSVSLHVIGGESLQKRFARTAKFLFQP